MAFKIMGPSSTFRRGRVGFYKGCHLNYRPFLAVSGFGGVGV